MSTELIDLLAAANRIVAFTGAGISTESGIPDFRSPGGVWTKYDPREFTFDRYVASADVRSKSWDMRHDLFSENIQPNAAHKALARLEDAGKLGGVITQNVDGLHQDAGSANVIEIHGTMRDVVCIGHNPRFGTPEGCGFVKDTAWAFNELDAGIADPRCPDCGGIVKSATISFGQSMPLDAVNRAVELVETADLVLTIGSSLQVYPAADIPVMGYNAGAKLVIVNNERTPLDNFATYIARGMAGEILGPAVDAVLAPV